MENSMKKLLFLLGLLLFPIHCLFASDAETEKLQWHLNRVEWILRKVDTSSLTEEQKVNRTNMLDRLHSYTEAGKFPNNDKFPWESVPFFRGSNGNLCAVGYLMDADPDYKTFIENTVKSNNNVQLMDVQTDPTVNAWAKKYGFSILELAMIQPTYEHMKQMKNVGWNAAQALGRIIKDISYKLLLLTVTVFLPSLILVMLNRKRLSENKVLIFPNFAKILLIVAKIMLVITLIGIISWYMFLMYWNWYFDLFFTP